MKKWLLVFAIMLGGFVQVFAQSGDLEVVSVDPQDTSIPKNGGTSLVLAVNQNGPDDLPIGSARVSISINTAIINWKTPMSISDDCGNVWIVQTSNVQPTTKQIQLRNGNAILANRAECVIHIPVIGVQKGTGSITVTSTVFGAGVSDPNGTNQGATGELVVTDPLPVTLVKFTVNKESEAVQLDWSTTEETNSDRFEIMRSKDGKNWSNIGSVQSNGESKVLLNYMFTDKSPMKGENVYRLKMIDKDETFTYSVMRSLKFNDGTKVAYAYPNPSTDKIYFDVATVANIEEIAIFDIKGRIVFSTRDVIGGVDVKKLITGTYVLRISNKDNSVFTQKIIVSP